MRWTTPFIGRPGQSPPGTILRNLPNFASHRRNSGRRNPLASIAAGLRSPSPAGQTHLDERFGIRQIEFLEHGPFQLNGKRVLLRGTHRHADHAGVAAAMSDDLVREEMRMIREMGANFIRLAHYQQDRLVLDQCDELGLMVWEEAPWCRAGVGDEALKQNAKAMLANMIDQHYNHPSVILWGLGNEDDWPDEYPTLDQRKYALS